MNLWQFVNLTDKQIDHILALVDREMEFAVAKAEHDFLATFQPPPPDPDKCRFVLALRAVQAEEAHNAKT